MKTKLSVLFVIFFAFAGVTLAQKRALFAGGTLELPKSLSDTSAWTQAGTGVDALQVDGDYAGLPIASGPRIDFSSGYAYLDSSFNNGGTAGVGTIRSGAFNLQSNANLEIREGATLYYTNFASAGTSKLIIRDGASVVANGAGSGSYSHSLNSEIRVHSGGTFFFNGAGASNSNLGTLTVKADRETSQAFFASQRTGSNINFALSSDTVTGKLVVDMDTYTFAQGENVLSLVKMTAATNAGYWNFTGDLFTGKDAFSGLFNSSTYSVSGDISDLHKLEAYGFDVVDLSLGAGQTLDSWTLSLNGKNADNLLFREMSLVFNVSVIPEPSEIAAILGLLALGFTYYRKRR